MLVTFSGKRLRDARKLKKLSQADMADLSGTTVRYVRALERGERENPSAILVCRFSLVLDVDMGDLMEAHAESGEQQ